MKRNILYFVLIIIAAVLSYEIDWFEFIFLFFISLSFIFLIIIGVIHIFRKKSINFFKVPALIICVCFFGVFASLFRPYEDAVLKSDNVSEKLQYAYETDQNDRKQLKSFISYFSDLNNRDDIRLNQVKKIYEQGKISKSIDKFYAAFVYHHSDNSKDYETASKLASDAAKDELLKDNYQVQWLRKAAYDRWMLSIGKPEKYNTQNKFSIDFE